jgi:flagellar hook-associated protein 2
MASTITFSGLASGLDTAGMLKQLVALERQPITKLQQRQSNLNSVSGKLNNIKTLLTTLQEKARALDTRSEVIVSSAVSSDESVVTATVNGQTSNGTYDVTINQLATASRSRSSAFASKTDPGLFDLALSDFTIQAGSGTPYTVQIDTSTTLQGLADEINGADLRVRATIVHSDAGYQLQIDGMDVGEANGVTITENGGDPENPLFATTTAAADAQLIVDGLTITSASNTVTDAIAGVTLQLKDTTAVDEDVQIDVQSDSSSVQTKIEEFVSAYNAVMNAINAEFAFKGTANTTNSLSGDSSLRNLQRTLMQGIGKSVSGLSSQYNRLYAVGVQTQSDGTLTLDTAKLAEAVAADSQAVADLFATNPDANTTGVMASLDTAINIYSQSSTGILAVKIDGIAKRVAGMDDQIDRLEMRVDKYEEIMTARFAAMENLISSLKNQGSQMQSIMNSLNSSD